MRRIFTLSIIVYFAAFTPMIPVNPVTSHSSVVFATQQDHADDLFSEEELENLLAPIALYPDPLLAQVLVAATFPDQIDEAARFLWAKADPKAIDYQPWDVSVKAVAHYPTVLYMMADDPDWTTTLGQAYVRQSTDVMMAVQNLRHYARSSGSLVSTEQMAVIEEAGTIMLWPVHPRYLYVPVYDPAIVYLNRGYYGSRSVISFGLGFAIGSWLNYDCDWRHHRVYYHGWVPRAGWVHRYGPRIQKTNIYVNNRYAHVTVNRTVLNRRVNDRSFKRHHAVHRRGNDNNVRVNRPGIETRVKPRVIDRERRVNNRIFRRNIDSRDPSMDADRDRFQKRRVERIGPDRSIKRERVKPRVIDRERRANNRTIRRNVNSRDPSMDADRDRFQKRRVERIGPDRSIKRERVKPRVIDRERRENNRTIRRNVNSRDPRMDADRNRIQERRVERIEPEKSIKRERVKKRHDHQADRQVTAQVQRRMDRHNTSAFRERKSAKDSRAANWRGRTSREQAKHRTAIERSPKRSANASADRRNGGKRSRNNRQR